MALTVTNIGSNSTMIDYSATTTADMFAAVDTYIKAHGWSSLDTASWTSGTYTHVMTYRTYCKDNATYKYAQVAMSNIVLQLRVYDGYDTGTKIGTHPCYNSNVDANSVHYNLTSTPGTLYLFVTNRYILIKKANDTSEMVGCFELKPVIAANTTPPFAWISGYSFCGQLSYQYTAAVPSTIEFPNTPSSASLNSRITIPIGSWGGGTSLTSYALMSTYSSPFGGGQTVWPVYDMLLSLDNINRYPHGIFYGIKVTTTNLGVESDILNVKCDSDGFVDSGGTNNPHMILSCVSNSRFVISL